MDQAGQVDALAAAHDLAEVQVVTEDEIRRAIQDLNQSTETIKKQTESLQQQRQALDRLVQKRTDNEAKRKDLEATQHHKLNIERQTLSGEVGDLSHSLEIQISDLVEQEKDLDPKVKGLVRSVLQSDDKLLASLEKLGRELHQQDPNETQTLERIREICMRLIKTTVEIIRTRLDRVYLTSLAAAADQSTEPASREELKALQEEVESLYAEILPVAQMSVEQQHLEPAVTGIAARDGQSLQRTATAVAYVRGCMDHVVDKLARLTEKIEAAKQHQAMSSALIAQVNEEISAPASPPRRPSKPVMPASPVRKTSPVRNRANTGDAKSRRRSSGLYETDPIETLCSTLGLMPPDEDQPVSEQVAQLRRAVIERTAKGQDIMRNAQDSYEALATSHLEDMRAAVQLLLDSVLAETSYSEVKLVDPEFESSVVALAREVDEMSARLEKANASFSGGYSEKREEIIQRWGD